MLAKLTICYPWLTLMQGLKRESIDKYWLPLIKLDIVGTGIFQGKASLQSHFLNIQRQ